MLWEPAFKLDIPFDEPFSEYTTRCNSKTYYYLAVSVFFDIPLLVHSYQYKQNLLKEVRQRTGVESAPIFCIQNRTITTGKLQVLNTGIKILSLTTHVCSDTANCRKKSVYTTQKK